MSETANTPAPHGTPSRYNNGDCRCVACKTAWATYCRNRARERGRRPRAVMSAAKRLERIGGPNAWLRNDLYYADRSAQAIAVHLTELGMQIIQAAQARTGRDYDDLVEQLLRSSGPTVGFDELRST